MRKKMLKAWQCCLLSKSAKARRRGFTLLELLIAVAISGIVVSGLLYLVVELIRVDNREIALETVQRDTQRALDYIADDLQEAVFVYEDFDDADTFVVDDTEGVGVAVPGQPILAFWKINPIDEVELAALNCDGFSTDEEKNECRALEIRRGSYDLVVYTQINTPGGSWKGSSRLARYELRQYNNIAPTTLDESGGYVNPRSTESGFSGWQKQADENAGGNTTVLVDYIAEPNFDTTAGAAADCDVLTGGDPIDPDDNDNYVLSPPNARSDTSFFACVRNSAADDPRNQDVFIFLKGDTTGLATSLSPASAASRFPVLQTQVLVRGILDKSPAD